MGVSRRCTEPPFAPGICLGASFSFVLSWRSVSLIVRHTHRMNNIPPPIATPPPKKSVLLPLGILLILLGIFVPRPLTQAAQSMQPGTLRSVSFLATDLFRLCFFAGVGCAIIGARRNSKLKKQPPKSEI